MESYNEHFLKRTKAFALAVIRLSEQMPRSTAAFVLNKQLLRSATSVAANYRAVCLARSDNERYAKLCIVVEETDETLFWLEMIHEAGMLHSATLGSHLQEAKELTKVFTAYRSKINPHNKS